MNSKYRNTTTFQKGHIITPEVRLKISITKKGKRNSIRTEFKKGLIPWNKIRDGISPLYKQVRDLTEYLHWRDTIRQLDNYTCRICGKRGGELHVDHHPFGFAHIFKVLNIRSVEDALSCDLLWDISNGRTLCVDCHKNQKKYQKGYGYL